MWAAFGGRDQMLAAPTTKVRRVTLYLAARNAYEVEQEAEIHAKEAELTRKRELKGR